MGDHEPRLGAGDGCLPVLGQAAAASEPGIGPLHHPPTRQELEAYGGVGALDDLDPPVALAFHGAAQIDPLLSISTQAA
jgi:hypothetical protein